MTLSKIFAFAISCSSRCNSKDSGCNSQQRKYNGNAKDTKVKTASMQGETISTKDKKAGTKGAHSTKEKYENT
jgi:hypothetical protein